MTVSEQFFQSKVTSHLRDLQFKFIKLFQMIPVSKDLLPVNKPKPLTIEEMERRRTLARQRHQEQQLAKLEQVDEVAVELQAKLNMDNVQNVQPDDVEDDVFIGFARVFSGTLRKGAKLYALMPKHDPRLLE